MTAAGVLLLVFADLLILFASRRAAAVALLCSACLISQNATVIVGGIHLSALRISALVGMLRVVVRSETLAGGVTKLDRLMLVYALVAVVTGTLLEASVAGFVNRSGAAFDLIGTFFVYRFLVAEMTDLDYVIRGLAVLMIPLAVMLLAEKTLSRNFFSFLGGAPLEVTLRGGKVRAAGPFAHAILAGTFAATSFPIILTLWWKETKDKVLCVMSTAAIVAIIYSCASSGPVMSFILCLGGFAAWRYRGKMRRIRWMIIIGLIALQLAMKAPIWYLLARIDLTGSSTGWHRAALIDSALRHFGEWWFLGTLHTRHWMPTGVPWNPNQTDITNHYLLIGVNGGIFLVAIFIAILIACFKVTGLLTKANEPDGIAAQIVPWALGVALFSHVVTFISVAYFDQTIVLVYLLFAMIAFLATQGDQTAATAVAPMKTPGVVGRRTMNVAAAVTGAPSRGAGFSG